MSYALSAPVIQVRSGHQRAMQAPMSIPEPPTIAAFTPSERGYIRRELDMFFSTLPTVAEGFYLKVWWSGPQANEPKLSPVAKGLIERGLMRLDTTLWPPRIRCWGDPSKRSVGQHASKEDVLRAKRFVFVCEYLQASNHPFR